MGKIKKFWNTGNILKLQVSYIFVQKAKEKNIFWNWEKSWQITHLIYVQSSSFPFLISSLKKSYSTVNRIFSWHNNCASSILYQHPFHIQKPGSIEVIGNKATCLRTQHTGPSGARTRTCGSQCAGHTAKTSQMLLKHVVLQWTHGSSQSKNKKNKCKTIPKCTQFLMKLGTEITSIHV